MSKYTVYVTPSAWQEVKDLPGHMRQRIKHAIDDLTDNPRPSEGKALDIPSLDYNVWRLRLDKWRIVYVITEMDHIVDVLAVHKRPPYDYGDLEKLLASME